VFKLLKKILGFSILLTFISLFATPLNAGLNDFHFRIIQVAFINGYIRALQSDLEKLKFMKNNAREMKEYVYLEADKYMKEVTRLNVNIEKEKETKSSSEAYTPQRWW